MTVAPSPPQIPISILPAAPPAAGGAPSSFLGGVDPRHPALGFRCYGGDAAPENPLHEQLYDTLRLLHGIPEGPMELPPNEPIPIEW